MNGQAESPTTGALFALKRDGSARNDLLNSATNRRLPGAPGVMPQHRSRDA
jgi:hypothetical protein